VKTQAVDIGESERNKPRIYVSQPTNQSGWVSISVLLGKAICLRRATEKEFRPVKTQAEDKGERENKPRRAGS
jgi:hypothetical protein